MEVSLAVLADYANISQEGKLNVMGLFTNINAPALPWVHPQMQLILIFEAGMAEWDTVKNIEIKLMDEDANKILSVSGDVKVPKGQSGSKVSINSMMNFHNVKFDKAGDYVFAVLIGEDTKKEIPLRVNYTPQGVPPKKT